QRDEDAEEKCSPYVIGSHFVASSACSTNFSFNSTAESGVIEGSFPFFTAYLYLRNSEGKLALYSLPATNRANVKLNVVVEETFEELEERTAPKLAVNHYETLVLDFED